MSNREPKEIQLSEILSIFSKTDLLGNIRYANTYFCEVSGYSEQELIGAPHNIIRHPDMPKVIFKLMWSRLKKYEDVLTIVKNRAKNGDYYWVTTLFETKYNPETNKPEYYLAIRKAAPKHAVETIIPLYETLLEIEKKEGVEASEEFLFYFLERKDTNFDDYMKELVEYKGAGIEFFNKIRKMFG